MAEGRPPLDGIYTDWHVVNSSDLDAILRFTSQPACPDETLCNNSVEASEPEIDERRAFKACGHAMASATFLCTTTHRTVTDSANVEVGCDGKSAEACTEICNSERVRGMCGSPCDLAGTSHPPFDAAIGACWRVQVNGTWYCYWDHSVSPPDGPGYGFHACCPNRSYGSSNTVWGQGSGDYTCTVTEVCASNPEFGGLDGNGEPGVHCTPIRGPED
jgi:hypothetical protein